MKYFICPICKKKIDLIADFGELSKSSDHCEYRLSNKRYHMKTHKKIKNLKKKEKYLLEKLNDVRESIKWEEHFLTNQHLK